MTHRWVGRVPGPLRVAYRCRVDDDQTRGGELIDEDLLDDAVFDDIGPLVDPDAVEGSELLRPVDRVRRSVAGGVVAASMLGLRDVLEGRPEREEIAIVCEAPPRERTDAIQVFLDFEHKERSVVIIRRPSAL